MEHAIFADYRKAVLESLESTQHLANCAITLSGTLVAIAKELPPYYFK
jgi:hypothetical protein